MKRLEGQVAIVTGASRGIGRAIARELAATGASVVINYFTSEEAAQDLLCELNQNPTVAGQRHIAVRAGVAHIDDVEAMVGRAIEEFGKIDILVNNAGVNRDRTLRRMSPGEWQEVLNVDLTSVFYCTRAVAPHMIERNYGRIVNISSIIGQTGNIGQANYAAAKAGIIAFTKSAAQEFARYNITVNAICPGFVETDMLLSVPEEPKQAILGRIPLGRFGRPEEVATFVRYLVGEGDWITGQQFNINGGMFM